MNLENKALNDPFNFFDEDVKNVSKLSEPPPAWANGMSYGYHEGCLVFVVHISLWRVDGEPCESCATFYRAKKEVYGRRNKNGPIIWRREAELALLNVGNDYIEQPVLVRIVEFGEQPEQGRQLWVRSIVRLRPLKTCLDSFVGDRPKSPFLLGKCLASIGDRELKDVMLRRRIARAFFDGNGIDEVIEARPQVMNTVSGNKRPSVEGRLFRDLSDKTMAATIGVTLFGDSVRLSLVPCNEFRCDSLEVLFGASQFQEGTSEFSTDHAIFARRDSASAIL